MCTQLRSGDVRESFGWLLLGVTFYCCVMSSSVEILDSLSAGVSRLYSEIPWTPNPYILYIYVPKYTYIQLDQVVDMNTQGVRTSGVGYKKFVLVNSREREREKLERTERDFDEEEPVHVFKNLRRFYGLLCFLTLVFGLKKKNLHTKKGENLYPCAGTCVTGMRQCLLGREGGR